MESLKKVTVIGGSGFVGTNLCQNLSDRQIPFEIIDIKSSKRFPDNYKVGDVRDLESLRATVTGDIVVNLAAVHRDDIRDKSEYVRTNVEGAENVAKICSERKIRKIIFTSTVAVYGFAEPGTDECGEINPFNEYGKTKYQAEEKLREWYFSGENSLIIIRPTVIFGEGNRGNVFNLLKQISSGNFVMIGNGTNYKSMAYVGNVAAFIEKCIDTKDKYAIYNYVDSPDLNMNTLVRHVRKSLNGKDNVGIRVPYWLGLILGYAADIFTLITGRKLSLSSIRVKKFCSSTSFISSKSKLDGFKAPYTLREGLDRTIYREFIEKNKDQEIFFTE